LCPALFDCCLPALLVAFQFFARDHLV
jgi:hypothetical protein